MQPKVVTLKYWMQRDINFAEEEARQAKLNEKNFIVTDGNNSLIDNFKIVEKYFELI